MVNSNETTQVSKRPFTVKRIILKVGLERHRLYEKGRINVILTFWFAKFNLSRRGGCQPTLKFRSSRGKSQSQAIHSPELQYTFILASINEQIFRDARRTFNDRRLQPAFSLKIRLVLDLIQRDCKPRCYRIGIETRREKTDCWLFCSKRTLRPPRNEVTIVNCTTVDRSLIKVCGGIAGNKNQGGGGDGRGEGMATFHTFSWMNSHNLQSDEQGSCQRICVLIMSISHASQTTEPSRTLSNITFKDILQKETAVNFLKRNEFKAILPDLKKV